MHFRASHPGWIRNIRADNRSWQGYISKIGGLKRFAHSVPPDDLVALLDADVIVRPGLTHEEVRLAAVALLRASRADFIMGAEMGRFVSYHPSWWKFGVPDWARRRCPAHLTQMQEAALCTSRIGPCSKPPEPRYPNSGLLLGRAALMANMTMWILRTYTPSKLRADDQTRYFKYFASHSTETSLSLDHCSDIMLNWHQMPAGNGSLVLGVAPFSHLNGPLLKERQQEPVPQVLVRAGVKQYYSNVEGPR